MICECCSGEVYSGINAPALITPRRSPWLECPGCGVFINLNYRDIPIQDASGIRIITKEVLRDVDKFVPILDQLEATGPVYDVCTGIGGLPYLCKLRGIEGQGNDVSPGAIAVAKDLFEIDLELGEFEDMEHEADSYGEIVFHHGIEHVRSPLKALAKASQMLFQTGKVYLSHPVMRDFEWVNQYGDGAHRHEWTFPAFRKFLAQFTNLAICHSGQSAFNGPGAAQYWILEKI